VNATNNLKPKKEGGGEKTRRDSKSARTGDHGVPRWPNLEKKVSKKPEKGRAGEKSQMERGSRLLHQFALVEGQANGNPQIEKDQLKKKKKMSSARKDDLGSY